MFDCRLQIFNMAANRLSFTKAAKEFSTSLPIKFFINF